MKKIEECFFKVKNDYLKHLKNEKIFNKSISTKIQDLKKIYIPLSYWIENKYKKKNKTLILGISGGQGSGKTTVAGTLKIILNKFFNRRIYIASIDDFYKTSLERNKMSKKIHPLFKTRGVPGTHNINLIKNFINLIKKKKFKKIKLPKFNKANDDRYKKKYWFKVEKKPEIVIVEGWCVGAQPQTYSVIQKPINKMEKNEDKNFKWRKYVNEKLKSEYKNLFSMIDYFIFIRIPNFKMVLNWRFLQEKKLKKKSHTNKKIMNYNQIKRFIMFYERITLQMIKDLSRSASVVLFLKKNHSIKKVLYNK